MSDQSDLGQWAATRHEVDGLAWSEIAIEARDRYNNQDINWNKVRDKGRAYIKGHKDEFPGKPGVTIQSNGNIATIHYRGPNITTPPELLDYIGYDPTKWVCVDHKVKTFQGQSKREDSSLKFVEGRISGTVDKGGVIVVTMFSVYVKLVRRHPVPIEPVITPICPTIAYRTPPLPSRPGLQRALIISDPQFGFRKRLRDAKLTSIHDRRVLDVALQIAAIAKPDRIMWPGDNLDMTDWTRRFTRAPEFFQTTRPALLEWHWWLSQFRQMDESVTMEVFDGNHEDRMRTAMQDHLPAACGLSSDDYTFTDPQMLELFHIAGLDALGIRFIGDYPNGRVWLNDLVNVTHGENSKLTVGDYVTIEGHYHRRETQSKTRWNAKGAFVAKAVCFACACKLDGTPGRNNHPNWQNGIGLVDYDPNGSAYQITPIPIDNGRAIWNRQLFVGRDRVDELREAYPGWNW